METKPLDNTFPWEDFRQQDGTLALIKAFAYMTSTEKHPQGFRSLYVEDFVFSGPPIKSRQIAGIILWEGYRRAITL